MIQVFNHNAVQLFTVKEEDFVSGCWYSSNDWIFIYITYSHVKFIMPTGDSGILRSITRCLAKAYYARDEALYVQDRACRQLVLQIDLAKPIHILRKHVISLQLQLLNAN